MAKYIVNPGGATHSVDEDLFTALMDGPEKGWREATSEEVAAWYAVQGLTPDGEPLPKAGADEGKGDDSKDAKGAKAGK